MLEGFLVVQKHLSEADYNPLNPSYRGVMRIPPLSNPLESMSDTMWEYLLGETIKEETGLIEDMEKAKEIFSGLKREGEDVEIVYVTENPEEGGYCRLAEEKREGLGWDVAGVRGDYWSIVADMSDREWAKRFRSLLNRHGLFQEKKVALEYLDQYRKNRDPDWDSPFDVVFVARVMGL